MKGLVFLKICGNFLGMKRKDIDLLLELILDGLFETQQAESQGC
jgi:hypothetical protein